MIGCRRHGKKTKKKKEGKGRTKVKRESKIATKIGEVAEPRNDTKAAAEATAALERRMERVLLALASQAPPLDTIILGAWGCGVFCNDPLEVARLWRGFLVDDSRFVCAWRRVIFAILDTETSEAFRHGFSGK
jgi:uncharacterized protein (TIGR02452 family)